MPAKLKKKAKTKPRPPERDYSHRALLDKLEVRAGQRVAELGSMDAGRIVEEGPAGEVIRKPRHPSTQGLLRAAPRLTREKLVPIPGAVPLLDGLPPGYAFGPRCAQHIAECDAADPMLRDAAQDHRARCILVS